MATIADVQAEMARRQQQPQGITLQDVQGELARRQQISVPIQPIAQQPVTAPAAQLPQEPGLLERAAGGIRAVVEPALTLATGALAEPVAGLAGLAVLPFEGAEEAARTVEATRRRLTFQPTSEAGRAGLEFVGKALQPISDAALAAEEATGELGFQIAGPIGGAIGASIPTAVLTAFGIRRTPKGAPDITPQRAREIQEVIKASEKQGVDVLTSDIFQPKSIFSRLSQQFSERIPLLGVGGKRATQQTQRVQALDNLDQSVRRVEAADIIESLDRSANKARVAAGKRIESNINNLDPIGAVPTAATIKSIDSAIAKLEKPGKLKNDVLVADFNNLKQTLQEAPQSFRTLREFRTDARTIADKVDPAGRSQLRSTDKVLMDNVIRGITKDLDDFVLKNTDSRNLTRYKGADKIYGEEAKKLTKSRLKTVLDKGDVNPELVNNLLFSSSPSQVKLLFNNLDKQGRQNARLSLYRRALDNATRQGEISPQRFVSELDKLGSNFNTFFRGSDRAELNGLKRLLEATKRAGEAGIVTPTGQATQIGSLAALAGAAGVGSGAALLALLGSGTVGLAAKAYESAGIRNLLIRLGKTPKRSTLEADLARSIPLAILESTRALEQQEQAEQ